MTATRHNQPGMILDADTTTNLRQDLQKLHTGGPLVVDLFADPGGWDEGLRATGYARNRKPRHVDWHDERSALTAEPTRSARPAS